MVYIDFQGGTHGHFLRYVLDRYSALTPPITLSPFTSLGTSHALKGRHYSGMFKISHSHLWGWEGIDQPHVVITVMPADVLHLQRIIYIRPADKDQDLTGDEILLGNSFNDKESIEKLYSIKIDKTLPRFILRDYCKLGFSDINNHGLITADKDLRTNNLHNAYYLPVDSFWDRKKFFQQIENISEKFKLDVKLDDSSLSLHNEFIDRLPQLKTRNRAPDIVTAIKENKHIDIEGLDVIEEAYIYSYIESNHRNVLTPFTNKFFSNTKEIIDYIKWYPKFYHKTNPTLPPEIG